MMELHGAYGGPQVHKTEQFNPTEVLISLLDEMPNAKRDELEKEFIARIIDDPDYVKVALKYYFTNAYYGIHAQRRRGSGRADRKARQEEIATKAAEYVQKIKTAVILDLLLPNGKTARESTFADCRKAGGMWLKIGAMGKPSEIVGRKITDKQANAVWRQGP